MQDYLLVIRGDLPGQGWTRYWTNTQNLLTVFGTQPQRVRDMAAPGTSGQDKVADKDLEMVEPRKILRLVLYNSTSGLAES